jgi:hypothetical protein
MSDDTLGDRIRARRDARRTELDTLKTELTDHIDAHFAALHARFDQLENRKP